MTDKKLCCHCREDDTFGEFDEDCHFSCLEAITRCEEAVKEFRELEQIEHVLFIAINVLFLYGQQLTKETKETQETREEKKAREKRERKAKKDKRNRKETELLKKVSAIRNSSSGALVIQLVGLKPEDSFTGAFDEFADVKLNGIIEDGKLFSQVFKKNRMRDIEGFDKYEEFLVLYVEAASQITSSNLKTKIPLDFSIEDPSPRTLRQYLKDAKQFDESFSNHVYSLQELQNIGESRSLQLKTSVGNNLSATEIWERFRLGEYISAFSKNRNGGCIFVGIGEEDKSIPCSGQTEKLCYISKENNVHGAAYENKHELETRLKEKANTELLVCDYTGERVHDPDLIKVNFIPVNDSKDVLMVEVRHVNGLVFNDEEGPLAYKIVEDDNGSELVRIESKTWFKLIKRI